MNNILNKHLIVEMPDGSEWSIPVSWIADNHSEYYAERESVTLDEAKIETMEIFKDDYEIIDWASNNMDWDDVVDYAEMISEPEVDYDDGWINGEKKVLDE